MYKNNSLITTLFLGFWLQWVGAQPKFSLEDIYRSGAFSPRSVYGINWMNDGQYYTSIQHMAGGTAIVKFDITSGNPIDTLINSADYEEVRSISGYEFSQDESQMLLMSDRRSVYRRSFTANYFIFNRRSNEIRPLTTADSKQSYATFSPDGSMVAYVMDNNIYLYNIKSSETSAITTTGEPNAIIHGGSDWVYEEEFYITKTFYWSPDSRNILFYTFDEREVPEYNMQEWKGLYPNDYRFKYPKAGEKNSKVSLSIYSVGDQSVNKLEIKEDPDSYIARAYWANANKVFFVWMNRFQNIQKLYTYELDKAIAEVIKTEESDTYIDINYNDQFIFLENGESFLQTSEQDGYKHIYHYNLDGSLINQITNGEWEVTDFYGYDANSGLIYFQSTEISPLERHLYSIKLNGKSKTKLSEGEGIHKYNFSSDFLYYLDYYSPANDPQKVDLFASKKHQMVRRIISNDDLKKKWREFELTEKEFFTFQTPEQAELHGYMIKPHDFDPDKMYPVLMFVYGGPGSQQVLKQFGGSREAWHQLLAQKGFIVACVDNRGTGARGRDFKHITYGKMGKYEAADQKYAAEYLGSLPFIDENKIGIWGWSYGGYMSSLCLFTAPEIFKLAIAVAPVTNWRFYDTIYTERYLKTPQENPEGYDEYSPINHVEGLEGKFLLVHGTGDDNVHVQNSIELVNELIKFDKQFEMLFYPDRNHGIYGGNTRYHLFNKMTKFIEQNL